SAVGNRHRVLLALGRRPRGRRRRTHTRGAPAARATTAVRALPPIRTLTVGPGVPPGQPAAGCGRVADCYRRFGIAPTPECANFSSTRPVCHTRPDPGRAVRGPPWRTASLTTRRRGGGSVGQVVADQGEALHRGQTALGGVVGPQRGRIVHRGEHRRR